MMLVPWHEMPLHYILGIPNCGLQPYMGAFKSEKEDIVCERNKIPSQVQAGPPVIFV